MMGMKKAYQYIKRKYQLLSFKKYNTIAGTLVFFLLLSIVPLAFWLSLLFSRLPIDTSQLIDMPVFHSVKDILSYIKKEAESAGKGASVFLLVTTLYSSTNLFYQMRKSGEIIYGYTRKKRGWLVRVGAVLPMFCLMALAVVSAATIAVCGYVFARIFSPVMQAVLNYAVTFALSFALVFLLNIYICPYRVRIRKFLRGTLVTVVAWTGALIGFAVYLKIGNLGRLYGALNTLIVFMLWLYVMMICFVVGAILNSENISKGKIKKI